MFPRYMTQPPGALSVARQNSPRALIRRARSGPVTLSNCLELIRVADEAAFDFCLQHWDEAVRHHGRSAVQNATNAISRKVFELMRQEKRQQKNMRHRNGSGGRVIEPSVSFMSPLSDCFAAFLLCSLERNSPNTIFHFLPVDLLCQIKAELKPVFPLSALKKSCFSLPPPDVDCSRTEDFLSDEDFLTVFRCDRAEFEGLKPWRKLHKKREAGLWGSPPSNQALQSASIDESTMMHPMFDQSDFKN